MLPVTATSLFSNTAQATFTPPVARRQEMQWHRVHATAGPVTL